MHKLLLFTTAILTAFAGIAGVEAAKGNGEGHTPIVVCHWVPAGPAGAHSIPGPDGGSYNVIVVDDDGSSGNKNQRAHRHHQHDLMGSDLDPATCLPQDYERED
jgi:hypothetical protein